jgi:hypothetical protein
MHAVVQSDARRKVKVRRCSRDMVRLQSCLYGQLWKLPRNAFIPATPEKIHEINLRRADERLNSKRTKNLEAHLRCVFC